jgi:hypothetical protein
MFYCDSKSGLFGNVFFRNMTLHLLSKKYNTGSHYEKIPKPYPLLPHYYQWGADEFLKLGIHFEDQNLHSFNRTIKLNDNKISNFINNDLKIDNSVRYMFDQGVFCQSPDIVKYIVNYFLDSENEICKNIITNNKYTKRYKNNNDLFIHIRAGYPFYSLKQKKILHPLIPPQTFYEKIIESLETQYDNIYLSSDNINHKTCQELIEKYKITPFKEDKIDTILFGSTCKNIIISSGTFSFIIGILAFFSENVYFSNTAGKYTNKNWHPSFYSTLPTPKYKKIVNI